MGFITGNNSSSRNATQSTLTIAGFAGLHQIGICSYYHHVIDIISDRVANALQVYKTSNHFIPLKLRVKTFTVFEKGSTDKISKFNEATKYFRGTSLCAFQSMKPVDDEIARRQSHSDFSLPQFLKHSTIIKEIQEIYIPAHYPLLTVRNIYGVNWHGKIIKMKKSSG